MQKNNSVLDAHSRHFLNVWPIYAFGEFMLEQFPLPVGAAITRFFSELAYRFSPERRAALRENVRHVLARTRPELSECEIDRLAGSITYEIFVNRGVSFMDQTLLATRRPLGSVMRFRGQGNWEALKERIAGGRGALLVSGHLGTWHGGSVVLGRAGIPVRSVMYRNIAAEKMERKLARRGNIRQSYVGADPLSMLEIVRALRLGELVVMTADKPWDSRAIEVPFFGRPCPFPIGPARIARLADVPIFPAFCVWGKRRDYTAILCDPIQVRGDDPDESERAALAKLASIFECYIASNLTQWFNFTPVWNGSASPSPEIS